MSTYYITLRSSEDADAVDASGASVLATYPNARLVSAEPAEAEALRKAGLEITELRFDEVQTPGASFSLDEAVAADRAVPAPTEAGRTAYYVVGVAGPVHADWIAELESLGGRLHTVLPGFALLVGIDPDRVKELESKPWVRSVAYYRPLMRVHPDLRVGQRSVSREALRSGVASEAEDGGGRQVEISVFESESVDAVRQLVESNGGTVLKASGRDLVALVPSRAIPEIAQQPGIEAIQPHVFPRTINDVATGIMGVPTDHGFGGVMLDGSEQLVGIADGGLDTGDATTIHSDLQGRIGAIDSFPISPSLRPFCNNTDPFDDGPADANEAHGTHVTGSVAGDGTAATTNGSTTVPRGVATAAHIHFQAVEQTVDWKSKDQINPPPPDPWPPEATGLYGLPDDLMDLFQPVYDSGVRIHTNSWGANDQGQYSSNAREVDDFMFNHRDILILFAAGNAGQDTNPTDGVIDPGSVGSPSTAKNCLTVGATENNRPHGSTPTPGLDANWQDLVGFTSMAAAGHVSDNPDGMAAFSSRGPTVDNRTKPDLAAPGTNIVSILSQAFTGAKPLWGHVEPDTDPLHGKYCFSGGTSMATPLVAGAAAIVRQYLVTQRAHSQDNVKPSGALIKAFLVNGAVTISGQFNGEIPAGKNSVDGLGRCNLTETLSPNSTQQMQFDDDPDHAVESGQVQRYSATVSDESHPLKVALAWSDAPGTTGTGGIQNQLYLRVVAPDSTVNDGDTTAFPTVTNNVQQVVIDSPAAGTYEVQIHGLSVTQNSPVATPGANPRQDYAVVASAADTLTLNPTP